MPEKNGLERYIRQLAMPQIGTEGQARLSTASVLVVGAGGLGSSLLYNLAGMGVGCIGVCDGDTLSLSNLNRQFLHTEADIGLNKAESAVRRLRAYNSSLCYKAICCHADAQNADALVGAYDLIVLAVDTLDARLLLNRVCVQHQKPLVNGGVYAMTGMCNMVVPHKSACLQCLYGHTKATGGTPTAFPPVVSVIGSLEAQLAATYLLSGEDPLGGRLLCMDATRFSFDRVALVPDPACAVCGA